MKAKYINPLTDFGIEKIFKEKAELARLGPIELDSYENSLKGYRDLKDIIDTAFDNGKQEGN